MKRFGLFVMLTVAICLLSTPQVNAATANSTRRPARMHQHDNQPPMLANRHNDYHHGATCPGPEKCDFLKNRGPQNGQQPPAPRNDGRREHPRDGKGFGAPDGARTRWDEAHRQYHNGHDCPNGEHCEFFKQHHPQQRANLKK